MTFQCDWCGEVFDNIELYSEDGTTKSCANCGDPTSLFLSLEGKPASYLYNDSINHERHGYYQLNTCLDYNNQTRIVQDMESFGVKRWFFAIHEDNSISVWVHRNEVISKTPWELKKTIEPIEVSCKRKGCGKPVFVTDNECWYCGVSHPANYTIIPSNNSFNKS
jgi:hypothetical protein